MSASQAIRERIASWQATTLFTSAMFAGLGSRAVIGQALARLARAGHIERIGRGLYVVPKHGRFGFKVLPSPEQVTQAIATAEGAAIKVHGAEAARRFGLSTQMPVQAIFHITGSLHTIRIGKMVIFMRHAAPRKLILAGRPAGLALSALWYLGRNGVTPDTFSRIAQQLPSTELQALQQGKASMPAWMASALSSYESGELTQD